MNKINSKVVVHGSGRNAANMAHTSKKMACPRLCFNKRKHHEAL
jgi:hypothetical protein